AVRHQEHDRTRNRETRRQALDVQGPTAAARRAENVRELPRGGNDERLGRSLCGAGAPEGAHHRGLPARTREGRARGQGVAQFGFVAVSRKSTSALRSSGEPMRCSGILVPGVYFIGPTLKSSATVSLVQTMSICFSAGEKL